MQKTIFITGASTGLGKSTAKLFQSKGWQVIATMRNPEKETELTSLENVIVLPLDVTNSEQITETIKSITEKYSVDVVLNNAGYGLIGALESLTEIQIERQIVTNLFGVIRISKAFTPHFAAKANFTFMSGTDWYATDYRDKDLVNKIIFRQSCQEDFKNDVEVSLYEIRTKKNNHSRIVEVQI